MQQRKWDRAEGVPEEAAQVESENWGCLAILGIATIGVPLAVIGYSLIWGAVPRAVQWAIAGF